MKFLSVCVLSVAWMVFGYFLSQGLQGFRTTQQASVFVKGLSERVVKADRGIWEVEFSVSAPSFDEARKTYTQNVKELRSFFKELGFNEGDVTFSSPNGSEGKETDKKGNILERYYVLGSSAIISSADVDKIAWASGSGQVMKLLEKGIVLEGANKGYEGYGYKKSANPRYLLSDFDKLRPEMLTEALQSAKTIAQKFAEDGGVKVGRILSADQGSFTIRSNISESEPEEGAIHKKVRVVSRFTYALDG